MFIFPYSVKFLLFQLLSVFSKFRIFSAKFNSLVLFVSYEKKIPRAFIGSRGQRKPKGVSVLFFHRPSHIPSDFVVLISKPERFLNLSSRVSKWSTESRSRTKTVVSSAYRETLISFSPTLMPFMPVSFLIALPSISMPITNNSPDNGQPCLTPRSTGKNSDPNPLLRTQLETLLYKILTQFLMFGPKLNFSRQLLIKSLSMVSKTFLADFEKIGFFYLAYS